MRFLVVLGLCCSAVVCHGITLDKQWQKWKSEHGKLYADLEEEQARKDIWLHNYHQIVQHNQNEKSYFFVGLNQFSDLVMCILQCMLTGVMLFLLNVKTDEEYRDGYLSNVDATAIPRSFTMYSRSRIEVEQEIDWREMGFVSEVRVKVYSFRHFS